MSNTLKHIGEINNEELYIKKRLFDVNEINAHSWDKITSAHRRDSYYLRNLVNLDKENIPELSAAQIAEIENFWKPYEFAYKNDINTQKVFYQQSGEFDPSYIGFGLQRHSMVRFWNHATYATLRNKSYLPYLFPIVKHPMTYISNNYGIFSDINRNIFI